MFYHHRMATSAHQPSSQQRASSDQHASSPKQAPSQRDTQDAAGFQPTYLASSSERAGIYWKLKQPGRIPLPEQGLYPKNHGGQGVIKHHLHRNVLPDIMSNRTSRNRYAPARVVEVPVDELDQWRLTNKAMCEADSLMPSYAPEMRYALLTKHHFVPAQNLYRTATEPCSTIPPFQPS